MQAQSGAHTSGAGVRHAPGPPPGLPHCSSSSSSSHRRAQLVVTAARSGLAPAAPAPSGERRERTLRMGDMTATSSAVGTSINYKLKPEGAAKLQGSPATVQDFLGKLRLAWQIFFPEKPVELSPKDGAKQRLRMILVADRCGMSPSGLTEMKKNILKALEEFVDIESEEQIDISVSLEPELGTIYCVAVPVRRVKPEARMTAGGFEGELDGMQVLEWNPLDKDSDPSSRFPMGC